MTSHSGKRLIPGPQPATTLPDELVLEILILLPGKDLGRCKCVCKSWQSIIRSPLFREIHRSRHGSLMLYYSKKVGWMPNDVPTHLFRFYYSPLRQLKDPAEASISPMTKLSIPTGIFFDQGIRIVNGLVCVATSEKGFGSDAQLTIYSVCTGEKMRIPEPVPYVSTLSTFHLGYDPASRTYKLLRLIFRTRNGCHVLNRGNRPVRANIMTLRPSGSPSKWRKLNYEAACIADISMQRSVFDFYNMVRSENSSGGLGIGKRKFSGDDGVLCWFNYLGEYMIVFDLNEEKFRRLKLPMDFAGGVKQVVGSRAEFKECGRLALTLWVEHLNSMGTSKRLECFMSEKNGGEIRWSRQYCREYPMEVVKPEGLFDITMGSSDPGGILFMIPLFLPRAVYCYSYCRVNEMEEFWVGNFRTDPHFRIDGTPSYLGDSNHLYLALDDVLRGVF